MGSKWLQFVVLILSASVIWGIVDPTTSGGDGFNTARLLGFGLGMALMGVTLTLIPSSMYRIMKGRWPSWQIWLAFPISALCLALAYVGAAERAQATMHASGSEAYVFSIDGGHLEVTFPAEPDVSEVYIGAGTDVHEVTRAEFFLLSRGAAIRAEAMLIDPDYAGYYTDERMISMARMYATDNGLRAQEVVIEPNAVGRCVRLRAIKRLEVPVTYENLTCFGGRSLMMLYAASPSASYPPPEVSAFFGSLDRME